MTTARARPTAARVGHGRVESGRHSDRQSDRAPRAPDLLTDVSSCAVALRSDVFADLSRLLGERSLFDSFVRMDESSTKVVDASNRPIKALIALGLRVRRGPSSGIVGRGCRSFGVVPIGLSSPRMGGAQRPAVAVLLAKRGNV